MIFALRRRREKFSLAELVRWCNGNTAPFGGVIHGSNPCRTANLKINYPRYGQSYSAFSFPRIAIGCPSSSGLDSFLWDAFTDIFTDTKRRESIFLDAFLKDLTLGWCAKESKGNSIKIVVFAPQKHKISPSPIVKEIQCRTHEPTALPQNLAKKTLRKNTRR